MRSVTTRLLCLAAGLWLATVSDIQAEPMGTCFTYQGQLKSQGIPLDGDVDLLFSLHDAESAGVPLGELTRADVSVASGLFAVDLDFGSSVFDGRALWVEVAVRYPHDPTDTEPFVTLSPRQAVTMTPYALQTRGLFVDDDGDIGIGTNWPEFPLHASTSGDRAIFAVTENAEGKAVYGFAQTQTGDNAGVCGQTASDQGDGVFGWASSSTGFTSGVYGLSWSNEGTGISGNAFSSTGSTFGVHGTSNSDSGTGVYGYAGSHSGNTNGVYGRADSEDGVGVWGWAWSTTGEPIGVKGGTRSENGTGVYGFAGLNGTNIGVHGHTSSPDGFAGYFTGGRNYFEGRVGIGTESPGGALHVESDDLSAIYANNTLSWGYGVKGIAGSSTGENCGVYGESMSDEGYGVYGKASAETGDSPGVYGYSNSPTGRGVYGFVGPTGGVNYGVYGHSNSTNGHGVVGYHGINSGPGIGVKGKTASPDGYAGYFQGGRSYFEGNVGIGTESPDYPLHVETSGSRAIYGRSTASTGYGVYAEATGTTSQNYGGYFKAGGIYGRGVYCWASNTSGTNFALKATTSSPDGFAGYFSGGRNYFEGNVGIGIESPAARLQVEGTADVDPLRVRVDGTTMFSVKRNGRTNVGSNALPAFQLEVSGEGTAGKPGGGSWSSSSDRRLKKNIRDLKGSLDRLLRLRSVVFEYKDPEAINELPGERIGMIAQEVEEVFPDWVDVGGRGYKILTFRGFEALAVDALRELREEKDRQLREKELQIEQLERQLTQMQGRLTRLESMLISQTEDTP